ncbi:MAG TPA: LysR family transcriptional regulator [Usitatibacteraceae bacterium]
MDRIQAMQVFTRIVELRSFTRAADSLDMPRATLTYTIKRLESHLGVRLLQRTTRHVSPTLDGEAYYHRCVRLLADLEEAESAFGQAAGNPKGKLRIDLPAALGKRVVIPALADFRRRYPDIELEIGMSDRPVDLVREGVDCALRVGSLRDSTLVARRLTVLPQITCASREYIADHGTPKTLGDLREHWAVNFLSAATGRVLDFEFEVDGNLRTVRMRSMIAVNDADAYALCCEQGFGLIQVPRYRVLAGLADKSMKEVLSKWRPPAMPVHALYPHHRQLSPRVRVFVDWLGQLFADKRAGNVRTATG